MQFKQAKTAHALKTPDYNIGLHILNSTLNRLTRRIISDFRTRTSAGSTIVFSFLLLYFSNSTCSFLEKVYKKDQIDRTKDNLDMKTITSLKIT